MLVIALFVPFHPEHSNGNHFIPLFSEPFDWAVWISKCVLYESFHFKSDLHNRTRLRTKWGNEIQYCTFYAVHKILPIAWKMRVNCVMLIIFLHANISVKGSSSILQLYLGSTIAVLKKIFTYIWRARWSNFSKLVLVCMFWVESWIGFHCSGTHGTGNFTVWHQVNVVVLLHYYN